MRELWSTDEQRHYRPGHYWLFRFGTADDGTCIKKKFSLARRSWEVFEGIRFYDGECALVVEQWLHRTDADTSGLTFEEWNPKPEDMDPGAQPAFMILNSSELRGVITVDPNPNAASKFREVKPLALEAAARRPRRAVLDSHPHAHTSDEADSGSDPRMFLMSDQMDNKFRERCTADSFDLSPEAES